MADKLNQYEVCRFNCPSLYVIKLHKFGSTKVYQLDKYKQWVVSAQVLQYYRTYFLRCSM